MYNYKIFYDMTRENNENSIYDRRKLKEVFFFTKKGEMAIKKYYKLMKSLIKPHKLNSQDLSPL